MKKTRFYKSTSD